jgi:polygalacturonase
MKIKLILPLVLLIHQIAFSQQLAWVKDVGSKTFPSSTKQFFVNRYGAKGDGKTMNTQFIQKAIDACAKNGGGVVSFEAGTYVTGAIFLKANVQLRIDENVLLLGSEVLADYPEIETRIAGIEMKWPSALINVIGVQNAAITGKGVVNARGKFNWDLYWKMRKEYEAKELRWIVDYDVKRVRTVLVQNAENITINGVTFKNAGFWTVQLLYSKYITVDGVIIRNNEDGSGPSTDGIDVDSSSWVLIQNCDVDCNDDNFCLKAGRDWDGLRVNRPTEYVVIKDCIARRGAGLVTLGSETSGGIRHVLATGLYAKHTDNGLRIKSAKTRGGTIEDIHFENAIMDSVNNAFQFNLNWYPEYSYSTLPKGYVYDSVPAHWKAMLNKVEPAEKGIPYAKDIFINNVMVTNAKAALVATGYEKSLLTNFVFTNSNITAETVGELEFTKEWKFEDFNISVTKKKPDQKQGSKESDERLK